MNFRHQPIKIRLPRLFDHYIIFYHGLGTADKKCSRKRSVMGFEDGNSKKTDNIKMIHYLKLMRKLIHNEKT